MYKIIGSDQKEYGPISADQVRQWIADGRSNAQTRARHEEGGDWLPLSAFAEFTDVFGARPAAPSAIPAAPFPSGTGGSRDAALSAVKGPAIALIIIASLALAINLFYA